MAVVMTQSQIDSLSASLDFSRWLALVLSDLSDEERPSYEQRASELLVQAVCWCRLDLALQSGIAQENQCLADDIEIAGVREIVIKRRDFITSYIASELDLVPKDVTTS